MAQRLRLCKFQQWSIKEFIMPVNIEEMFGGGGGAGTVTNTGALTAGKLVLGNGGVDVTASAIAIPAAATAGDILSASGANTYANITAVALGQVLASGGVATLPAWTATPRLSGILDANGNPLQAYTATASAVYGLTLTNAALLGTVAIGVTAPTVVASSVAGTPISITAQAAVAGNVNNGAAAGGAVTITSGAAARLVSGNANGGNIVLATGAGIGTGTAGQVIVPDGSAGVPGIGFNSQATDGFFHSGASVIQIILNAINSINIASNALRMTSGTIFQWSSSSTNVAGGDLFLLRSAAATLQLGTTDVNGSAVAQTLRVQSAITGTDQNGANWTFIGSRQTGAGTPGDIIFQTSVKLASSTTQGTPVTGLTITGAIASMQPSVVIGNQALATTATEGFLYIPTCAGTPTGVPTVRTGRVALIYDTTNFQFWIYDGAWLQPKTPAGAALVTWQ
jgi:hypothetical protein